MDSKPIHRMHLKGPWVYEWLDGPHGESESRAATATDPDAATAGESPLLRDSRVRMPCSWQSAFGTADGRLLFRRRFQMPTGLDDDERVHIAFDGVGGSAVISVNEQEIGRLKDTQSTTSFDITPLLQPSNELAVDLEFYPSEESGPGGLWKPVAVQIHRLLASG